MEEEPGFQHRPVSMVNTLPPRLTSTCHCVGQRGGERGLTPHSSTPLAGGQVLGLQTGQQAETAANAITAG